MFQRTAELNLDRSTRVELSFAGAARQGPLGWAASLAADSFVSQAEREAFETAAAAWDSAVNKLADATHAWQDRVEQQLRRLFLDVVDAVVEGAATADAKAASFPLLRMYEHMEEVDDQALPSRAHPAGHKPCPRCGRSYPTNAKWCAICSVEL